MMVAMCFIAALIGVHLVYWFAIVPFHTWTASKLGWTYDPVANRFDSPRTSQDGDK